MARWWAWSGSSGPRGPQDRAERQRCPLIASWRHAEKRYRAADRMPIDELKNMRDALKPLGQVYARKPANPFGPLALRAIRNHMIKSGLARTTVNPRINRIRQNTLWTVTVELILHPR